MKNTIKAIITGSTGMVGEGVLHECLLHPEVESVLVINRKPCGTSHPKLTEILLPDFFRISTIETQLSGYDACFFCAGVSSVGMKEADYRRITYDLTMEFAKTVSRQNFGMTFCYVSGAGTDNSGNARMGWARIKGQVENDLMTLPFKAVYNFRPPFMLPTPGLKYALSWYKYVSWLYPICRPLFPGYFITLKELGLAMIRSGLSGYEKTVLETKDIVELAKRNSND